MLDETQKISVSYVVAYPIVFLLAQYCLIRHEVRGILCWLYLVGFCALRIIGAALNLHNADSTAAQIILGVGLSPLLLALMGALHESNGYVRGKTSWPLGLPFYIFFHIVIIAAVALFITGYETSGKQGPRDLKAGSIIFALLYVTLVLLCLLSFRFTRDGRDPRLLLTSVLVALPFLGARVAYTVAGTFKPSIGAFDGPIALRAVLVTVMEFVIATELLVAGIITRHIGDLGKT